MQIHPNAERRLRDGEFLSLSSFIEAFFTVHSALEGVDLISFFSSDMILHRFEEGMQE
jgi:hypothetical protein